MHTHTTRDDRAVISDGLRRSESYRQIGGRIKKDAGTVQREVQRNADPDGTYDARRADRRARERRALSKEGTRTIENDEALRDRIEKRLEPLVSPEVIAHDDEVCHETIYAWLDRSRPDLKARLPQRGRKRRRYGSKRGTKQGWTAHVRDIRARSAGAENRSRCKHYEGDLIGGGCEHWLTHTDRKSRYETVHRLSRAGADEVHAAVKNDPRLRAARSITYDRGSAFALWRMIEEEITGRVYFADPHAPWQRGSNENANGRLRRVYPKGTDLATIPDEDLCRTLWVINHTKRKCLNWRTPCEVDGECCNSG